MRIQSKTGRSLVSKKLAGAIFAVFALFMQPLVALDVPSAFAATEQTITVSPLNLKGWQEVDDNGNGGYLNFISGPSVPQLGVGSARLRVTAPNQGYMLAKSAYGGTELKNVSDISYSTYGSTGNNLWAPSMQINITPDVNGPAAWYGRLVYEPYMNGPVVDGQWNTWNADEGKWWLSKPGSFGGHCAQNDPCTLEQLTVLYPNIGVNTGIYAGVGFKAGSSWSSYSGSVDNFHFSSTSANDRYDFEPIITNVDYSTPEQGQATITVTISDNASLNLNGAVTFVRLIGGNQLIGGAQVQSPKYSLTKVDDFTYKALFNTKDFAPSGAEGKYIVYASITAANGVKETFSSSPTRMYIDNNSPVISNVTLPPSTIQGKINVDVTIDDSHAILEDNRYTFVKFVTGRDLTGNAVANSPKYLLAKLSGNVYRAEVDTKDFAPNGTGRYVLYVSAQDVLGNKGTDNSTRDVLLDNQSPEANVFYTPNNGGPTNQNVIATIETDEDATMSSDWTDVNSRKFTKEYSSNTTEMVTITDSLGNVTKKEIVVEGIDKVAPVVDAGSDVAITGKTAQLLGTSDDSTSSVSWSATGFIGSIANGNTLTPTVTAMQYGTYIFNLIATDTAGNQSIIDTVTVTFMQPIIPSDDSSGFESEDTTTLSPVANPAVRTASEITTSVDSEKDSDGEVLGTNTKEEQNSPVDKVAAIAPSEQGWKLWGIAWYWWLLALAALGTGSWYAARLYRNRKADF